MREHHELNHVSQLANTHFDKPFNALWTHFSTYGHRQIDYACIDYKLHHRVVDCYASDDICVGFDHRTLVVCLLFLVQSPQRTREARQACRVGWTPRNRQTYEQQLETNLRSSWDCEASLASKCSVLEAQVAQTAAECAASKAECRLMSLSRVAKQLIAERRKLRESGVVGSRSIATVSKELQKEIRSCTRRRKRDAIAKILEDFKNVARIPTIRSNNLH